MNTIQSLTERGIELHTAENMIKSYKRKIGTMNGAYEITDITYDFDVRGKIVTLKCSECGKIIKRTMIKDRNKWSELIKTCECQKENKRLLDFEKSEKIKKEKKEAKEQERIRKILEKANKPHRRVFDKSYIGNRYNFLNVIDVIQEQGKQTAFICQCEACGKVKRFNNPTNVVNLSIKSCGCMTSKLLHDANWKEDALSRRRLHRIWTGMKQRCYNKKSDNYESYGGRGIKICDEWLASYNTFENWAKGNGYSDKLSIDRINVNGNYEPSNCRWADAITQARNKRPSSEWKSRKEKFIYNGGKYTLKELCNSAGISEPTVNYRMKTMGMTLEQALKTPKCTIGRPRKAVNE